MGEVRYIKEDDLVKIIDIIKDFDYVNEEEIPEYDNQPDKIDDYFALIDRLKNDTYYPDIFSKAASLFLNINGHYFSNGNKRLAVFSTIYFLESNGCHLKELTKDKLKVMITKIFEERALEDYEDFSPTDFAMYNVALITAGFNSHNVSFDDGKNQVECFLRLIYVY